MKYAVSLIALAAVIAGGCTTGPERVQAAGPQLAHNVYFALNDSSKAAKEKLVTDCYRYLRHHPGVLFFAAGEIVEAHAREVNVRDWDVGLHIVFTSKEYHDQYQKASDHQRFIEANGDNWKSVRVFDTFIDGASSD